MNRLLEEISENTNSIQNFIQLIENKLKEQPNSEILLQRILQLYRSSGDLDKAIQTIEKIAKITGDHHSFLHNILIKKSISKIPLGTTIPCPFMTFKSFLTQEKCKTIMDYTLANQSKYEQAKIYGISNPEYKPKQDIAIRNQLSHVPSDDIHNLFKSEISPLLPRIMNAFGLPFAKVLSTKIQMSATSDNQFGKAHQDINTTVVSNEIFKNIAFVYYYNRIPKKFQGGDLLLYDTNFREANYTNDYTRILNENNSLVVFPSSFFHEITTVQSKSMLFRDSRFAVSFWVKYE